jgi:hypothetical protein
VEIMIGTGNSVYLLSGRFNTLDGKIVVEAPRLDAWGSADSADYAWGGVWSEKDFAKMALMGVGEANHSAGYRTSRATNLYDVRELDCRHTDCVTQTLDAVSTGAAAVAAGCAATGVGAPCAIVAGGVSTAASFVGTARTAVAVISDQASIVDGAVAITTLRIGAKANPYVALGVSIFQWSWDTFATGN